MNSNICDFCKPLISEPNGGSNSCATPLISDSTFFGPSIDETIIYMISLLPNRLLAALGILHAADCLESKTDAMVDLDKWLKAEYMALAKEVADSGLNFNETCRPKDAKMIESRRFVLNRLAELMEKKAELEKCLAECSNDQKGNKIY
ncbi:uncharacterized protein [Rhodnius prolixus]|uniref:uncharacterized protein n=1 Tax=Rhodnius prolixus TaxID=13249 RepID=UPI003D18E320